MAERTVVEKDYILSVGDIVFFYFSTPGGTWMKSAECAMVESSLEARSDIRVRGIDYFQEGQVIFEIEVLKTNPALLTVGIIVVAILAAMSLPFWAAGWMFERAELVIKAPATQMMSAGVLIVAAIALLSVLKKR